MDNSDVIRFLSSLSNLSRPGFENIVPHEDVADLRNGAPLIPSVVTLKRRRVKRSRAGNSCKWIDDTNGEILYEIKLTKNQKNEDASTEEVGKNSQMEGDTESEPVERSAKMKCTIEKCLAFWLETRGFYENLSSSRPDDGTSRKARRRDSILIITSYKYLETL